MELTVLARKRIKRGLGLGEKCQNRLKVKECSIKQ